jgi:AAA domain-containing protein
MKIDPPAGSAKSSSGPAFRTPKSGVGGGVSSSATFSPSSIITPSSYLSTVAGTPIPGTDMVRVRATRTYTIAVIHGPDKSGKSTFVTRFCPGPVMLINVDRRAEGAAEDAEETYGKDVYYLDAALPGDIMHYHPDQARELAEYILYDRVIRNFDWALANDVHTVGIDTGSEFTELMNYAFRGHPIKQKPTKSDPGDFGASDRAINTCVRYFTNKIRETRRVNLIILSRTKEVYDGATPTGIYIPEGTHKIFHQAADWAGYLSLASEAEMLAEASDNGKISASAAVKAKARRPFSLKVTTSGYVKAEEGNVYTDEQWGDDGPFAYACSRLMPKTTVEDWK